MFSFLVAEREVLVREKDEEDGEQGRNGGCSMFVEATPHEKCEGGQVDDGTRTAAEDEAHALPRVSVQ